MDTFLFLKIPFDAKEDSKCPNEYIYLSRAARVPIVGIVCEEAAVQGKGQAVFGEVTPHALPALGHHP